MWNYDIVTASDHRLLVSVEEYREEFPDSTENNDVLTRILTESVDRLERNLERPLSRAKYVERNTGSDDTELFLQLRPIIAIDAVTFGGASQTLSEFTLGDRERGTVYRAGGFPTSWTWRGALDPNFWAFTTVAGYMVSADDVVDKSISVSSADNSYNSSSLFPTHLRPGDVFEASDWTGSDVANNGRRVVVTATKSKITVTNTLVTSIAASRTLTFANIPGDLKRAVKMYARSNQLMPTHSRGQIISSSVSNVSSISRAVSSSSYVNVDDIVDRLIAPYKRIVPQVVRLVRA